MSVVGTLRMLDGQQRERGTVRVQVDDGWVIVAETRDGVTERRFYRPGAAEKLSEWLNAAADQARGA